MKTSKKNFKKVKDIAKVLAKEIAEGNLVRWFQGRPEMGPRALGNRSILADPRNSKIRNRINELVKHREAWSPFASSILEDYAPDCIGNYSKSP